MPRREQQQQSEPLNANDPGPVREGYGSTRDQCITGTGHSMHQSSSEPEEVNKTKDDKKKGEDSSLSLKALFSLSPNVHRVFLYNALDGIAFSIWNMTVAQILIYRIAGNSNADVGWVAGVTGAAQVLAALVGAHYGDKSKNREMVTRTGAICGTLAVISTIAAAYVERVVLFYLAAFFWGYYMGFSYPASEALFADSVPSGQRTAIYSYKWAVSTVSYVVGYGLNTILFLTIGNHWSTDVVKTVLYLGLGLAPLSFMTLWTVRDKHGLGDESETLLGASKKKKSTAVATSAGDSGGAEDDDEDGRRSVTRASVASSLHSTSAADVDGSFAASMLSSHDSRSNRARSYSPVAEGDSKRRHPRLVSHQGETNTVGSEPMLGSETRLEDVPDAIFAPSSGRENSSLAIANALGTPEGSFSGTTGRNSAVLNRSGPLPDVEHCNGGADDRQNGEKKNEDDDAASGDDEKDEEKAGGVNPDATFLWFRSKHVPFLLASGDFISALGAGMTIRFFPLYFVNVFNVDPALLNGSYVINMVGTGLIASGIQKLAKTWFGRVPSMLLVRVLGGIALLIMAYGRGPLQTEAVMLPMWIFRSCVMNSPLGLSRSVIMDHVPKNQRTRWNAVESFTSFSWAGSAVVGGYLVDAHGYAFTFGITAMFQLAAVCIALPTVILTRSPSKKEDKKKKEASAKGTEGKEKNHTDGVDSKGKGDGTAPTAINIQEDDP